VICAGHWLVEHIKVFNDGEQTVNEKNRPLSIRTPTSPDSDAESNIVVREGYAYVGPRLCEPAVASDCQLTDPFVSDNCALTHYCRHSVWVPAGETEGSDNTLRIISDGGLQAAQWLQRQLGLAPIGALASRKSGSGP
jgi:hypothetical protein